MLRTSPSGRWFCPLTDCLVAQRIDRGATTAPLGPEAPQRPGAGAGPPIASESPSPSPYGPAPRSSRHSCDTASPAQGDRQRRTGRSADQQ